MQKIFVVEDDENIRELVVYALQANGFTCCGFESGGIFFRELRNEKKLPDLVLLDIMLPEEDGISILKKLRLNTLYGSIPVIMLTAKGSEFDKVRGLDAGADDYVTKPFGIMELISRINAVLRRASAPVTGQALTAGTGNLVYKNITLDDVRHVVFVDGERITLTLKEYELLYYLMLNTDIVMSRDKIMDAVWGYDFSGETRTVDMHIKTLRQKLFAAGEHIKTVRGVGYKIGE